MYALLIDVTNAINNDESKNQLDLVALTFSC